MTTRSTATFSDFSSPFAWMAGIGACVALLAGIAAAAEPSADANPAPADPAVQMWSNRVEPILSRACFKCHGESKKKGGLDLRHAAVDLRRRHRRLGRHAGQAF